MDRVGLPSDPAGLSQGSGHKSCILFKMGFFFCKMGLWFPKSPSLGSAANSLAGLCSSPHTKLFVPAGPVEALEKPKGGMRHSILPRGERKSSVRRAWETMRSFNSGGRSGEERLSLSLLP